MADGPILADTFTWELEIQDDGWFWAADVARQPPALLVSLAALTPTIVPQSLDTSNVEKFDFVLGSALQSHFRDVKLWVQATDSRNLPISYPIGDAQ